MKNFQAPPTQLNSLPTYEPWDPLPKPFYRLAAELPAPALRVALSLIELTCGWHRHEVQVAASVLAVLSGLSDRQVRTGLAQLREKGLLLEREGRAGMKVYSLIPALQVARKGEQHVTRSGSARTPALPPEHVFRGKAEHVFRHDQESHENKCKEVQQQHARQPELPTPPIPPEPVHDVVDGGAQDRITTLIGRLHREAGVGRWKATQLARKYPAQVINQVLETIPFRREVVHNLAGWVVCEIERGGYEVPDDLARIHADGLNRSNQKSVPVLTRSSPPPPEQAPVIVDENPPSSPQPEAMHSETDVVAEALEQLAEPVRRDMLNRVEERIRVLAPRWARRLEAEDALHCPLARVQLLELLAC